MVMRAILWIWVVVASLCFDFQVSAREYLDFNDPHFRPYPLAVPAFKDMAGGGGEAVVKEGTDALKSDLEIAGVFRLLDPKSFVADPKKEGLSGASINFADWINVGAEGLVKVGVAKTGTEVSMDAYVYDVATGKELVHQKVAVSEKDLRQTVHRFADAIVRHYTGNPSIFFTSIVFAKRMGGDAKSICTMDFDGYNERCMVENGSINLLPAWSADGTAVYFSSYISGGPHLYKHDLKTGKNVVVSKNHGLNIGVSVSFDGKAIGVTLSKDDNAEIYSMDPDGGHAKRLTFQDAIDSSSAWSPDGKRIAFVSERSGNPQLYAMNSDGSNVKRLTFQGNYNQTPNWSPRGDFILFNARDERLVFDLFKINPDSGEILRLTQDQGNNEHPSFSPDGNHVVFSSTRSGESKIYVMNADGTNQRLISRGKGEYTTPDWGPWNQGKE
jgi:TolB protein